MWDVPFCCLFVKLSAAVLTEDPVIHLFHHLLLGKLLSTPNHIHISIDPSLLNFLMGLIWPLLSKMDRLTSCLKHRSELVRLCFPFGNRLVFHFFYFSLSSFALPHCSHLLSVNNALPCSVENLAFLTKNFLTYSLMTLQSLLIEGTTTIVALWELGIRLIHLGCF